MTELLSPAGDLTSLKAAIASGADAVYLGLSAFNARIKATNFSEDNLAETVKYCHLFGVKVYITVNISVKNNELSAVDRLIETCKNAGVDAFIVTDMAAVSAIKRISPQIPMHASTQMGVCNLAAAQYAEKLGFTRVVLSREATLAEIRAIRKYTKLEIEYFVHGALCVAFSGKCLLSSVTNGGSGNRGRCLQPCRLKYTESVTGKDGYLLSTSDLCLVDKLKELSDAGVDSFKIEGRLRRPEYVYNTVKTYRKVIDKGFIVSDGDFDMLKSAFNRGNFTKGYSFDDTKNIMSVKVQGNLGVYAGKIVKIINGYSVTDKKYSFKAGEGYKLLDANGNEVCGGRIEYLDSFGYPEIRGAKCGYSINITGNSDFAFSEKRIIVDTEYTLNADGVLQLTYTHKGTSASIESAPFDIAENKPLDETSLNATLTKFGDGYFAVGKCSGRVLGKYFAPFSVINSLRRNCIDKLTEKLLNNYNKQIACPNFGKSIIKKRINENGLIAVELQNTNQISNELLDLSNIIIYSPEAYAVDNAKTFLKSANVKQVYIKLTPNARENDVALFEEVISCGFTGIYADSLFALTLAEKYNLKIFVGQGLNVFNNVALDTFNPDYYLASPELNAGELKSFSSPFVFAYGKLPLMNLSHCPMKLNYQSTCDKCIYTGPISYVDGKKYSFEIVRSKAINCYFTLYNSKITDISAKFSNCGFNYYLNMLQCDCKKAVDVVRAFKQNLALNTADATNGHLKRGVD